MIEALVHNRSSCFLDLLLLHCCTHHVASTTYSLLLWHSDPFKWPLSYEVSHPSSLPKIWCRSIHAACDTRNDNMLDWRIDWSRIFVLRGSLEHSTVPSRRPFPQDDRLSSTLSVCIVLAFFWRHVHALVYTYASIAVRTSVVNVSNPALCVYHSLADRHCKYPYVSLLFTSQLAIDYSNTVLFYLLPCHRSQLLRLLRLPFIQHLRQFLSLLPFPYILIFLPTSFAPSQCSLLPLSISYFLHFFTIICLLPLSISSFMHFFTIICWWLRLSPFTFISLTTTSNFLVLPP